MHQGIHTVPQRSNTDLAGREKKDARLRAVLDRSPCAVCLRDRAGRIYYRNPRFARSFDGSRFWRKGPPPSPGPAQVVESDGRSWIVSPFETNDASIRDLEGWAAIDISDRKQTEQILHAQNQEIGCILDGLPIMALIIDDQGTITSCRGGGLQLLGTDAAHVVGRNLFDQPGLPHAALSAALEGGTARFVWRALLGATPRHYECCFRGYNTRRSGAAGFALDVTNQFEAERPDKLESAILPALADRLLILVGRIDLQGRVSRVEGAESVLRSCRASMWLGRDIRTLLPACRAVLDRALAGHPESFTASVRTTDGNPTALRFEFLEDPCDPSGILFFARDVTERKQLERELIDNVDGQRRKIGADLHDDIGQLLTGASCLGRALAARISAGDHAVAEEVDALASIACEALGKIRDFARGLSDPLPSEGGLPCALENLAARSRRLYGIACAVHVVGGDPNWSDQTNAHVLRLCQEAVSNAVRHGRAGRVDISVQAPAGAHRVVVTDDGCGFDARANTRNDGAGLRLMAYRAALVGGTLVVDSAPGRGASIIITLPTHDTP